MAPYPKNTSGHNPVSDFPGSLDRVVNHVILPAPGTYEIDPVHTFVTFRAQHVIVGRVRGRFESVTGTAIIAEDPTASRVDVQIAAASISTLMSLRDDDLRSAHYLDAERYPTIAYRSSRLAEEPNGKWLLGGDLSIRDTTRPVDLVVSFGGAVADSYGNARIAFQASGSITRTDFGLDHELEKEAGGTKVRGDIFIGIDAELVRPL